MHLNVHMKVYKSIVNSYSMEVVCKRCGMKINSFSPMRKWCVDCRHKVSLEQAKNRKVVARKRLLPN